MLAVKGTLTTQAPLLPTQNKTAAAGGCGGVQKYAPNVAYVMEVSCNPVVSRALARKAFRTWFRTPYSNTAL